MTRTTTEADLQVLLDVVASARGPRPAAGGFPDDAVASMRRLVDADLVSYFELDVASGLVHVDQTWEGGSHVETVREVRLPDDDAFRRHYWQTPSCSYASVSGDDTTITARTDFYGDRTWHRMPMYREYFAPAGIDNEMMCCLPAGGTRIRRLIFFRSAGCDFDDRDRLLLALLRPHLAEIDVTPDAGDRPADLTPRQWELMNLVASGLSNAEIARRLHVTTNTVRKHLENIFARLEVGTRTAAVARAFGGRPPVPQ